VKFLKKTIKDEKRKYEYASGAGWDKILKENHKFFDKNPYAEIVLSEMSDRRNIGKSIKMFKSIGKIIAFPILSIINRSKKEKRWQKEKGIIISYLDRENDWGLIWPVAQELECKKVYFYFFVDKEVYKAHKTELRDLSYATVYSTEKLGDKRNVFLTISDLADAFRNAKTISNIISRYSLGSYLEYVSEFISYRAFSNGLYRRYFQNCRFSYSLGNRIFGFLHQKYGIQHFAMQHGEHNEASLRVWSAFTKSNVYLAFTYGSVHEALFKKGYGTNAIAVGSMLTRKKVETEKKNKIVYFTDSAWITSNKTYDREIKRSLDEFIELYNRNKDQYTFSLKLHPNDDEKYFKTYSSLFGNEITIESGGRSATDVLAETNICISLGSTVSIQAIKMGVIAVQLIRKWDIFPEQPYAYRVKGLDEVDKVIYNAELRADITRKQQEIIMGYDKNIEHPEEEVVRIIMNNINFNGQRSEENA
jgi:hypothetical protein